MNSTSLPFASIAHKGNFPRSFNVLTKDKTPWILDSGASYHMTGCPSLFSTYTPCVVNLKVKIVDGSLAIVAGKGLIILSRNLTLKSVLYVPSLTCNLLSISKLTHDQNCVAKFGSSSCQFQELVSRKLIDNNVMLWHHRLDHPSFPYLKILFPSIFNNKYATSFQCEVTL